MKDEMVIAKFANTTKHGAIKGKSQTHMIDYYNLDMIISILAF
ncbi:MAG: virulence RhuM family protein [Firmicutes bacterium]|nr:virulence RhuM family protein [Bacillota bacterium]